MAIVTSQPAFAQQDQSAGALKLDVVRMGMQGQNTDRCGHDSPLPRLRFSILKDVMFRTSLGQGPVRFLDDFFRRNGQACQLFPENVLACASQPVYISNQRVSY